MISRGTFFIYKNTLATFIARVFLKDYALRSDEHKLIKPY